MEGVLLKKGGLFGDNSWKAWYFVLVGRTLRFYAGGNTEGMPKAEAFVVGINPREELQGAEDHKPHRFDVDFEDGGVFCASAPSANMRQKWVDAITAATSGGGGSGGAAIPAVPEASPPAAPNELGAARQQLAE